MKKILFSLFVLLSMAITDIHAQDTYVLLGNLSDGETQLTAQPGFAGDGPVSFAADIKDGDNVIGFTQTLSGKGGWFITYFPIQNFDATYLQRFQYNLEYEIKTTWTGEIKLKYEHQVEGATEEKTVDGITRDGEWHKTVINLNEFISENIINSATSKSVLALGFVGGAYDQAEAVTIQYKNIKLVPREIIPDTEAPVLGAPTVEPRDVKANITVNATDNLSSNVNYEVSATEDFSTIAATKSGKAGQNTVVQIKGLTPLTAYKYYVRATDASGNVSNVQAVEFTTTDLSPEPVWYGSFSGTSATGADYELAYSITYTTGGNLLINAEFSDLTAFPGLANVSVSVADEWKDLTKKDDGTFERTTEKTFTEGEEVACFFYIPYTGDAKRHDFKYTVGSSNNPPTADTEKPVLTKAEVTSVEAEKAVITVNVTDDSGKASIIVSGENFTEIRKSVTADGTDQTVTIDGLSQNTDYSLSVSAADAAGNTADKALTITFKTPEKITYPQTVYSGSIPTDGWRDDPVQYPSGVEPFFPVLNYTITSMEDNRLTIHVSLSGIPDGVLKETFVINTHIDGKVTTLGILEAGAEYEGTTTDSYERGQELTISFHMPFAEGLVWTKDFKFTVGSESSSSGIAKVENGNIRIYAANGAINIDGAAGETARIFSTAGMLVYQNTTDGNLSIDLPKGMYIVTVGGKAVKIIL